MSLKFIIRRVSLLSALLINAIVLAGCVSTSCPGMDVRCRMAGVENGDSIFVVSINGVNFEHRSSNGGIEFYKNRNGTILKIRVWSGRGTYTGGEIDHYYFIERNGHPMPLGSLRECFKIQTRLILMGFARIR